MRRNKVIIFVVSLILALSSIALVLVGCVSTDGKHVVSFIMKSSDSTFWKTTVVGAKIAAAEFNIDVTFDAPIDESDYKLQNEMIIQAVDDDVSAICISAIDSVKTAEAVRYALDNGVKVVMLDSYLEKADKLIKIGTDNYNAGVQVGEQLLKREGNVNVAIVNFYSMSSNAKDREQGFRDAIAGQDRIKIVDSISSAAASDGIKALTEELIVAKPELNAIVTFNEITTVGVGMAIEELAKKDDIFVIGFDNNVKSIGDLENGYIDTLIVQNPCAMGYLAIKHAYNELEKIKTKEKVIDTKTIVANRENMFDPEVQKLLFPITK